MPRISLKQLASIDWGNTIDWHFEFDHQNALPTPFDKFVPAQRVTMSHANVAEHHVPYGNATAAIPLGSEPEQMTVVFVDDDRDTVLLYFEAWMEGLTEGGTATLTEAKRAISYYKTNRQGEANKKYAVEVYPTGELQSEVGETAEARIVTVTFNIVSRKIN